MFDHHFGAVHVLGGVGGFARGNTFAPAFKDLAAAMQLHPEEQNFALLL